jgi:cell shape-determining protein MreC
MDEIKSLNDNIEQLQSTQFSLEDEKALEEELESLMKESSQPQSQQPSPQPREISLPNVPTKSIVQSTNQVAEKKTLNDNERKAVLS